MLLEFPKAGHGLEYPDASSKPCPFDDAYLVRLRNKDEATARHFYKHFRKAVGSMLFRKFYRQREEDLADEVMAAVMQRVMEGEPREGAMLAAYVRGVCGNFIRMEIERRRSRPQCGHADLDQIAAKRKTPEESARAGEVGQAVWAVLGTLRVSHRNILLDVFYHELDRDEVRQKYGKTPAQMRQILFHARRRFQKEWRKRIGTHSER